MGHGAARELATKVTSDRVLPEKLSAALDKACSLLDDHSEHFAEARADEKLSQNSKLWTNTTKVIEGYFREIAHVLINSHQLSLDMGIDGGGLGARVWMEETGETFERIYIGFDVELGEVLADFDGEDLGQTSLDGLTYEWCEEAVVKWIITAAGQRY